MQQLTQQDTLPKAASPARRRHVPAAQEPGINLEPDANIDHAAEDRMLRTIALYLRSGQIDAQ